MNDDSLCRSIVRSIPDAVVVAGKSGLVVFLNPAAERLTGWTLSAAAGQPLSNILKVVSKDSGPSGTNSGNIVCGKTISIPEHFVLSQKGGAEKHVLTSGAALSDERGATLGTVLVLRDVTRRRSSTWNTPTRQKMEAIGALACGIAHDFGILIGRVDAHASSLTDSLIPKTKAHDTAVQIMETTREARELTSHLSVLAQASEPDAQHAISPVSTAQVTAEAARVLEETFRDHRVVFTADAPGKMPFVKADATKLLNSLICIFRNSVDSMPNGGTLAVRASSKNISRPNPRHNPDARKGSYTILSIEDTGRGMSRETRARLFEPFFTNRQAGLVKGLGMTIVHAIVQSWGGWIAVRSAPGKGTTVNLYLPAAEKPALPAMGVSAGGGTILVVDDSNSDLTTFRTVLEENGYRVHTATGGAEGLNMLNDLAGSIDLVIVDLIMPRIDGRDVFNKVAEKRPDVSVIMTSGFSRDYARSCLGHGGWGFVQKPVDRDQLLHAVARAFEQRTNVERKSGSENFAGDPKEDASLLKGAPQ